MEITIGRRFIVTGRNATVVGFGPAEDGIIQSVVVQFDDDNSRMTRRIADLTEGYPSVPAPHTRWLG